MTRGKKGSMKQQYDAGVKSHIASAVSQDFQSLQPIVEANSSRSIHSADAVANSGHSSQVPPIRPVHQPPGAVRVRGPGYEDGASSVEDTVQIGSVDEPTVYSSETIITASAAQVRQAPIDAPIKSCSCRELMKRKIVIFGILLVLAGVVLGVVFGVVLKDDDQPSPSLTSNGKVPPTPSPTSSPTITMSPTRTISWTDAGEIAAPRGETLTLSPTGDRVALIDSRFELGAGGVLEESTIVRVYDENGGTWSQLGNVVDLDSASSLSLTGNRLAVGSLDAATGVSVYELQNNVWNKVGNTIETEGWSVELAQNGNVIVVDNSEIVQLYQLNGGSWVPRGDEIETSTQRTNEGKAYSRMDVDETGTSVLVEQSVLEFSDDLAFFYGNSLDLESDPPDTPVSISLDSKVVTIAQPQSNVNGLSGNGKVTMFRFNGAKWNQADVIEGDVENGRFGWSHALSGDGKRIVIMNNPTAGGENKAVVYSLRGSSWVLLPEDVPLALADGSVSISNDGNRVAVGGEGIVAFYDLVGA